VFGSYSIEVDDDPLEGLREAVGDAFEGTETSELKENARNTISEEIETEEQARSANHEG